MSNEIEKSNSTLNKSSKSLGKSRIGQAMMAAIGASLTAIELPRMFNQLIIFLLDGSGSMTYSGNTGKSKGYEVHQAVVNVLTRLKESKNKASFDVCFWAFANETVEMFPLKAARDFDLVKDCFNPCEFISDHRNTLCLGSLHKAKDQALAYIEKYKNQNTKVLIIILGDGAIADYSKTFELKQELNTNPDITFSSILFESPNWTEKYDQGVLNELKENFANLASTNADYMSTVDADKIRNHMIQSITKISNI